MCESVHAGQWGERPVATSCPPSITSEPLPVFSLSPSVCFCLRLMNSDWDICTFHKPWLRLSPLCVFFTVFEVEVSGWVGSACTLRGCCSSPAALKPLSAKSGLLCLPTEHGENSSGSKLLTAESSTSTWRLIGLAPQPGIMQSGDSGGASNERAVFNGAPCLNLAVVKRKKKGPVCFVRCRTTLVTSRNFFGIHLQAIWSKFQN